MPCILVITPIDHIDGLRERLEGYGTVVMRPDHSLDEIADVLEQVDVLYTNPNKSKIYIGRDVFDKAPRLCCVCTASTGTNHIDKKEAKARGIRVVSLTKELSVLEKISSTAELAFTLLMASLRHLLPAVASVKDGHWNYLPFVGRQLSALTVGIVGYGRLGKMMAHYVAAFGAKIFVCDPYVQSPYEHCDLKALFARCDAISLHVHVTDETMGFIDENLFSIAHADLILVNTSRGEIVDERALCAFLKAHPQARYASDVISQEISGKERSVLLAYAKTASNVILTPHIGGMTKEGQAIAYHHAAELIYA